jgi:hypothetical protein
LRENQDNIAAQTALFMSILAWGVWESKRPPEFVQNASAVMAGIINAALVGNSAVQPTVFRLVGGECGGWWGLNINIHFLCSWNFEHSEGKEGLPCSIAKTNMFTCSGGVGVIIGFGKA